MKFAVHTRLWGEEFAAALQEAGEVGFRAVETFCISQWFSKPDAYRALLEESGLTLAAMECGGEWVIPQRADVEREGAARAAQFLARVGAEALILSGGRRPPEGAPPERYDALWKVMNGLGGVCRDQGIQLCFHPRQGTLVEYRDQIALLMDATDPDLVKLCLDTGELARTGSDPLEVVRSYGPRIGHVHLSDLDWNTHRLALPGQGALDLPGILAELRERSYPGWITAETDRSSQPMEDARTALGYLQGLSGVQV